MKQLTTWISDIYTNHGWIAALITLVVLSILIVSITMALGIDLADAVKWLEER